MVWDLLEHDAAGNATEGPVVVLESRNSQVHSEEPVLTTVVGLEDVIVVSTADAVLVAARTKVEQVKALVDELKGGTTRRGRASPQLSPLGLLPGRGHVIPLQGQAHRREAGQHRDLGGALHHTHAPIDEMLLQPES